MIQVGDTMTQWHELGQKVLLVHTNQSLCNAHLPVSIAAHGLGNQAWTHLADFWQAAILIGPILLESPCCKLAGIRSIPTPHTKCFCLQDHLCG